MLSHHQDKISHINTSLKSSNTIQYQHAPLRMNDTNGTEHPPGTSTLELHPCLQQLHVKGRQVLGDVLEPDGARSPRGLFKNLVSGPNLETIETTTFISRPRPRHGAQTLTSKPRLWTSDSRQEQDLDNTELECSQDPKTIISRS